MHVFFNTSPVIFLEKLGLLDILLPQLWEKVYITGAVINEINDKEITGRTFFRKYSVKDKIAVKAMPSALHKGESESIIGAVETGVKFLIVDDIKAKKKAHSLGIETMGTIGVLLVAIKRGILSKKEAISYLQKLKEKSFWISESLLKQIIEGLNLPV